MLESPRKFYFLFLNIYLFIWGGARYLLLCWLFSSCQELGLLCLGVMLGLLIAVASCIVACSRAHRLQ